MIQKHRYLLVALFLLAAKSVLRAQIGGCDDSPEAPTDVLLLVGSVGMFYGSSLVMKALHRKR
jgi:XrtJ-associated TM-motif-TM protein